jgi:hypothetical protein
MRKLKNSAKAEEK